MLDISPYDRVVGFGSGGMMRLVSEQFPYQIDYLVDNDKTRWGTVVDSKQIYAPSKLLQESHPEKVLVIVFSWYYRDIFQQVRQMGNFCVISAGQSIDEMAQLRFDMLESLAREPKPLRSTAEPCSDQAIVMQGPLVRGMTSKLLRFYAKYYPDSYLILSTWEDSDQTALQECHDLADVILLNELPSFGGTGNVNYQLRSTIAGIKHAKIIGAQWIMKVRTDYGALKPDLFPMLVKELSKYDNTFVRKHGRNHRIIIAESFTARYLMYCPSDMFMFGHIEDMELYWDLPPVRVNTQFKNGEATLRMFSEQSGYPEIYLGRSYAKSINLPLRESVYDWWMFLKEFYIVLDDEDLGIFWYKNFKPIERFFYDQFVAKHMLDHKTWLRMIADDPKLLDESNAINIDAVIYR